MKSAYSKLLPTSDDPETTSVYHLMKATANFLFYDPSLYLGVKEENREHMCDFF